MTDQSPAEGLFVETARNCITEDSIEPTLLVDAIIQATVMQDREFLLAVANAAIAYVDDLGGCAVQVLGGVQN